MAVVTRTLTYSAGASFLVLSLLSPRSRRARLYLNVLLYVLSLGICSVWGVLVSLPMSLSEKTRLNINWLVARSFHLIAGNLTGLKFKVEGAENFQKARPAVLVGNHQTGIDILYLGKIFPKFASIMAKQELKYAPLLGQYMSLSGAVFIDRKNRHDAVKAFEQVAEAMKTKGLSLWVFPEGTRSNLPFPDLLPFKKGAFHLAVQAQVPIVPVVCENYHRYFDGKTRFESGTVRIKVLPPVDTKGLKADDVTNLTTRVREQMLSALQSMDRELERADVSESTSAAANAAAGGPKAQPPSPTRLGGIAKLASYLVGTGKGPDVAAEARDKREKLIKAGKSGEEPEDFNLLSESDKGQTSAVQQPKEGGNVASLDAGIDIRARAGADNKTSASNTSDETDEGAVFVKRP